MKGDFMDSAQAAACQGKQKLDRVTAGKIARKAKIPMVAYRCSFCGGWHVGPPPPSKKPRRKRK